MPKQSAKTSTPKAKTSKAAFVRSIPATTPAKDVVAKAKIAGISLTDAYVYNVRATSKAGKKSSKRGLSANGAKNGASAKPGAKRGPRKRGVAAVRVSTGRGAEELLRAVAAELGLARAIGVLEAEHTRVRRLLGT